MALLAGCFEAQVIPFAPVDGGHAEADAEAGPDAAPDVGPDAADAAVADCPVGAEDACRVVDGELVFRVRMRDPAESGTAVCRRHSLRCLRIAYTPGREAAPCLAFYPGLEVTQDDNGTRNVVRCRDDEGDACGGRDSCHHCPLCNFNNDCNTNGSELYSEIYVICR